MTPGDLSLFLDLVQALLLLAAVGLLAVISGRGR
jgi:hypothetical protein